MQLRMFQGIFKDITGPLQESALKIVLAERNGDTYDAQLVIGVRDSFVNLCSNRDDRLMIYREHFEEPYIKATADFYRIKAVEQLQMYGVQSYMRYADAKLREEEARAERYLEQSSIDALKEACVSVLVSDQLPMLLAECTPLIKSGDTERLLLMFRLLDRVPDGSEPMLNDLETHIVSDGLKDMISAAESKHCHWNWPIFRFVLYFNRILQLVFAQLFCPTQTNRFPPPPFLTLFLSHSSNHSGFGEICRTLIRIIPSL